MTDALYFGCDTETYNDNGEKGLKSIQIATRDNSYYFTTDDWLQDDQTIRYEICNKFFTWLFSLDKDVNIAFFNLNFDSSQFLKWLVAESGLIIEREGYYCNKGHIKILESERKIYSIQIRPENGRLIRMIDIANFLQGVTLNQACLSWIGKEKVDIPTKVFPKLPATDIEKEYAITDAKLTYELYIKLINENVIEGHKTLTIGARTLRHFKQFMSESFNMSLMDYFYKGASKEEIEEITQQFENEIRQGVRGGICQAWHKGFFKNCIHIDAKSMYPSQMVRDFIPVG